VADVGTGSGIVAIATARHAPRVRVTAIDVSPQALAVGRDNAVRLQVADRVEFVESDLFAAIPAGKQFDFVASNPPYVATEEFANLAPEVRAHEPSVALVAGASGTSVIEPLVSQAAEHLADGGWLLLEISPMLRERVEGIVSADGRFEPGPILKDLAGLPRVVQARRK
jgi:release factor glutamine methyltransferase